MAIADAYDAMVHDRPDRRAMSHEGAVATAPPVPDRAVLAMTQGHPQGDRRTTGHGISGARRSTTPPTSTSSGTLAPDDGFRVNLSAALPRSPTAPSKPGTKGRVAG